MKILLLMQWFDPEPQIKGLAFAKKLRDMGNEVEVLTGFPNYPGGIVYPGYAIKFFQIELMDGIRIIRVPLYPSHDSSGFRRMLNYFSFGFSSFIAGLLFVKRPDVIYSCGPPVTVGISSVLIGLLRKVPVVYDIQDLWPDSLAETGMFKSEIGLKFIGFCCNWLYRKSTHITVQSPGLRDCLIDRGVPNKKVSVIYNWSNETLIDSNVTLNAKPNHRKDSLVAPKTFDVLFAGNMGKAQDMDSILETAKLLQNENPLIRILLMGGGIELPRLKMVVDKNKIKNIIFLPRVPMSEVGKVFSLADVLLVHLKNTPLFSVTIPSKTQAYMAAGKPIVMAVAGDASRLIQESGAGVCAIPSNARSVADAIMKLAVYSPDNLSKMGEKGRSYYSAHMSINIGAQRYQEIFSLVL